MNDMFAARSDASSPSNSTIISSINETFLLELLYLRSKWNLRVAGHLPRLSPDPAFLSSTIPAEDKNWLETSWSHWWDLGISWLSRSDSRRAKLLLLDYRPSPEALLEVLPPRWGEALYGDNFDLEEFNTWVVSLPEEFVDSLEEMPEHQSRAELSRARDLGLRILIVLPLEGYFFQQVSGAALLLSGNTYRDRSSFASSLVAFAGDGSQA